MRPPPSLADYVASLGPLSVPADPTALSPDGIAIKAAAASLTSLTDVSRESLDQWCREHPEGLVALALTVGLSQEKLKNVLKDRFGTSSGAKVCRTRPRDLVTMLDEDYDLLRQLRVQRRQAYDFADVLVARGGSRAVAARARASGRLVEDDIEAIVSDLGLAYRTRTVFTGRDLRSAPCDLVIMDGDEAAVVVAAKGFDSTGSKLTDAVREIKEMADVRLPSQYVMVVIDGIGWKNRMSDLRRIHALWTSRQIDGMYTRASLDTFRSDLGRAARLRGLLR